VRDLDYGRIDDPVLREYIRIIKEDLANEQILKGEWKFVEYTFTQAETNKKIPHKLGFTPKDVLQLSLTGAGSITWNYSSFDETNLDITTTGACVVRAFIGRYRD